MELLNPVTREVGKGIEQGIKSKTVVCRGFVRTVAMKSDREKTDDKRLMEFNTYSHDNCLRLYIADKNGKKRSAEISWGRICDEKPISICFAVLDRGGILEQINRNKTFLVRHRDVEGEIKCNVVKTAILGEYVMMIAELVCREQNELAYMMFGSSSFTKPF